jgi:nitrogen regulatory protein PII
VEIIIEAMMQRQLIQALHKAGVTGYTIMPVGGGSGRSGQWTREGQIGRSEAMVSVICLIRPDRLDPLLESIAGVVDRHIGVVSVSDADILWAERF